MKAICHSRERPKHCVLVLLPLIQNQAMCGQTMAICSMPLPCHTFLRGSNRHGFHSISKMVLDPLNQIIFEDNVEHCWIARAKDAATSTRLSPQLPSDSKILNRCVFELQSCKAFCLCMGECSSFQIGSSENGVPSNAIVHHNVHHYCHFVVFTFFLNLNHC